MTVGALFNQQQVCSLCMAAFTTQDLQHAQPHFSDWMTVLECCFRIAVGCHAVSGRSQGCDFECSLQQFGAPVCARLDGTIAVVHQHA